MRISLIILIFLLILAIIPAIVSYPFSGNEEAIKLWWQATLQNLSSEMFGAAITYIVLDLILRRRQEGYEQRLAHLTDIKIADDLPSIDAKIKQMKQLELLKGVTFSGNNYKLEGADFSHTDVSRSNYYEVSLKGATFSRTIARNCNFDLVDFESADLKSLFAFNSSFIGVNFSRAILENAKLVNCKINSKKTKFYNANLRNADLQYSDLSEADLRSSKGYPATDLTGANFSYTCLRKANLNGAILVGVNFTGACLIGASFDNCNWGNIDFPTIMPDGTAYLVNQTKITPYTSDNAEIKECSPMPLKKRIKFWRLL